MLRESGGTECSPASAILTGGRYVHLHLGSLLPRICNSTASPLCLHLALLLHVPDVLPRTEFSVVVCVHANDISATQGDRMVYVGGLKERKNVVEVFGVA